MTEPQTTLLPCPCCGSDAEFGYELYVKDFKREKLPTVFCSNYMCQLQVSGESRPHAMTKWNRRQLQEWKYANQG